MDDFNSTVIELPSWEQATAWDEPILFMEWDAPDIHAKGLPGVLGEFAAALAQTTETPEALSVMTILGVISMALATRFVVSPKEGWCEPINIYTLIALPPANHKSWVLNACLTPLVDWENAKSMGLDREIKWKQSERKTQEKVIEVLRHRAGKAKDDAEQQRLMDRIADKEATLTQIPVLPVLFINDATPEALATLVHEQGGRMAIFSDEGGIIETLGGLYNSGSANIDIFLKGIDGGEVRIRRKDRHIGINPYLTIVLTVQPIVIRRMAEKRVFLGNGALERFLYVVPKSQLGYRTHDKPAISKALYAAYHDKITGLLNQFYFRRQDKIVSAHVLTLTAQAYSAWREFQYLIEIELRPEGKLANCPGWGGKICGFALRIAGLLHGAEYGAEERMITESTMKNALEIALSLTEHAVVAFGVMRGDPAVEDAKTVWNWIKANGKLSFTQSEITLAMRNKKWGKAERLHKILQVLHERHYISAPVRLPTRKPTTLYHVNPVLFQNEK